MIAQTFPAHIPYQSPGGFQDGSGGAARSPNQEPGQVAQLVSPQTVNSWVASIECPNPSTSYNDRRRSILLLGIKLGVVDLKDELLKVPHNNTYGAYIQHGYSSGIFAHIIGKVSVEDFDIAAEQVPKLLAREKEIETSIREMSFRDAVAKLSTILTNHRQKFEEITTAHSNATSVRDAKVRSLKSKIRDVITSEGYDPNLATDGQEGGAKIQIERLVNLLVPDRRHLPTRKNLLTDIIINDTTARVAVGAIYNHFELSDLESPGGTLAKTVRDEDREAMVLYRVNQNGKSTILNALLYTMGHNKTPTEISLCEALRRSSIYPKRHPK
jgi:hypothetical protein